MEQHNLTLTFTRIHVLNLYPRKAPCFRSMFSSSTLTPYMRLGYFTKLLRLSICIELMVALMPTIQRVSPPLSLISTSTLSMPSYDIVIIAPPLPPMHYFIRDHATTPCCSPGPLSFVEILS
ncbi:hypothetical protein BHE74_00039601 [Ensete ventricosum]|nr:hypothetical protein GW17_00058532 [Ensete ventricosum]RWW53867.1 hypothetical protein BHE74_00039601 [Ensete ventricosum]RZS15232.1 hypothetical protein BHM03_00047044 [Ensete ventricosum]